MTCYCINKWQNIVKNIITLIRRKWLLHYFVAMNPALEAYIFFLISGHENQPGKCLVNNVYRGIENKESEV